MRTELVHVPLKGKRSALPGKVTLLADEVEPAVAVGVVGPGDTQVEGTTVLWGPPGFDLFFHWIMVHLPHHVDMRIPCYHLPKAARAIAAAFPDDVVERPISVRSYAKATRACKLHDFEAGTWMTYEAARTG